MEALNFDLLLRILIAHFLADFIFQPSSWARKKDDEGVKSRYLWLHLAIHTITLSVLLWSWNMWPVILWVCISHFFIDAIKSQFLNTGVWIFIVDQFLHLIIIGIVWINYTHQIQLFYSSVLALFNNEKLWWMFFAYLLLSIPSSVLIGRITQNWSKELEKQEKEKGLENAGKWIGVLERLLIFTFIIVNQFSAIGILLAAKSVFRYGELRNASEQKKAEYIIIGTFLSFSIAIVIGLIFKFS